VDSYIRVGPSVRFCDFGGDVIVNLQEFLVAYSQPFRIVLILQANQAFWFKWKNGKLLESFVEPVSSDLGGRQSRCPWIDVDLNASGPVSELVVELILDTSLDELDRVKVDSHSSKFVQRIQRNTLIRKLSADFPDANVQPLPDYLEPDCVSILHHVIPEHWDKWLQVLQTQSVTITHVVTGTELLCHWSGTGAGPRLLVQDLGSEKRHLLVDGSVPIYMRVIPKVGTCADATIDEWNTQSIRQTLVYVKENVLPADSLPLVTELAQMNCAPSHEFAATRLLSALYLGHTAELIVEDIDPAKLLEGSAVSLMSELTPVPMPGDTSSQTVKMITRTWARIARKGGCSAWRLPARARIVNKTLMPSLQKNRQRSRLVQLQRATLLCAAVATITTAVASVHGFSSSRERNRISSEQAQLRVNLGSLSQSVSALHLAPAFVVHSLIRIENHQTAMPLNPETVLATIAGAITLFPSVTLNGLSWTVVDGNHFYDETFTSAAGVSVRDEIWSEDTPRAQIQLEISGVVDGSGGLREKQGTIDSFVSHLKSVPGIRLVRVMDSPVEAVRSSVDLLGSLSNYRVSMLLGSL
jgi:hypothetical protein